MANSYTVVLAAITHTTSHQEIRVEETITINYIPKIDTTEDPDDLFQETTKQNQNIC